MKDLVQVNLFYKIIYIYIIYYLKMLIKKTLFRKECRKLYNKLYKCLFCHHQTFPDESGYIFEYSPFIHT